MGIRVKEVYNNGEFSGSVVKCPCGAVYRMAKIIVSEEFKIDSRKNFCDFCHKPLGEFDGSALVRGPSFWWRFRHSLRPFFRTSMNSLRISAKSEPLVMRYRYERTMAWIRGLMKRGKSSRLLLRLREVMQKLAWKKGSQGSKEKEG